MTKLYGIKRPSNQTLPIPAVALEQHGASIASEDSGSVCIKVPTSTATALRDRLLEQFQTLEIRDDFDRIGFTTYPIDVRGPNSLPGTWARNETTSSSGRDLYVIQFASVPREEWLSRMREVGSLVLDYLPQNAYLVFGERKRLSGALQSAPVQYFAIHQPIHKVAAELRASTDAQLSLAVIVARVPEVDELEVFLQRNAGRTLRRPEQQLDRVIYRATIPATALVELARIPAVVYVEPISAREPSGEREVHLSAGDTMVTTVSGSLRPLAGNYRTWLSSRVSNYTTAAKVAILDTGFDTGSTANTVVHRDFLNNANSCFVTVVNYTENDQGGSNADCYGHGTMVAGLIGGNAGGTYATNGAENQFYMGLGMAPAIPTVVGRIFNFRDGTPPSDPQDWTTIYGDLASRGVPITSNSWNDYSTTAYNVTSQTFDRIVRHSNGTDTGAPMSVYVSAGNHDQVTSGAWEVIAPANGKNITSVGGSENYHPNTTWPDAPGGLNRGVYSDNGFHVWSNSQRGTVAADGRFKPDLVAPATAIESPRTVSRDACKFASAFSLIDSGADREQHYWSRGTSFSSPLAATGGALLYTFHKNRSGVAPSPALLKAMQINFALDLTGQPRVPAVAQGWGKIDLAKAFKTDGRYRWFDQTTVLTNGGIVWFPGLVGKYQVKDTSKPVRVTMVWTDRHAAIGAAPALVNDLDLIVLGANGAQFCVGNDNNPSTGRCNVRTSGGIFDRRNNVEQITFTTTDLGTQFSLQVNGYQITGDAIDVWNGTTPRQDFAIFIENVVGN